MVTISHLVAKMIEKKPFLEEALAQGIVNYAALAEKLTPFIEKELGKKVRYSAVMMAIRRFRETIERGFVVGSNLKFKDTDITIKSDLVEITLLKSPSALQNVQKVYSIADNQRGDFLTVTQGIYEVMVICPKQLKSQVIKLFYSEKKLAVIDGLAALTLKLPVDAVDTIGYFYAVTKALNWDNINIVEIVSTFTEMTYVLKEDDVARAFDVLKTLS